MSGKVTIINWETQKLKLHHVPRRIREKVRTLKGKPRTQTGTARDPVPWAGRKVNQGKVWTGRANQGNERKSKQNLAIKWVQACQRLQTFIISPSASPSTPNPGFLHVHPAAPLSLLTSNLQLTTLHAALKNRPFVPDPSLKRHSRRQSPLNNPQQKQSPSQQVTDWTVQKPIPPCV